ncbi:MAG: FAD-dependent monooxygenase [Bacillota bacterium]
MATERVDVAIIGAGPVGATFAALACAGERSIALFESRSAPSRDARTLALSHASARLLEEIDAWPASSVTPIESIHISQKGGPGRTLLTASEQHLPALGYTVGYAALQQALDDRMARAAIPVHYGESCEAIALSAEEARVRFASGNEVDAKLLVLADGGANVTRIPGLAFAEKDYGQTAMVAAVETDRAHGNRAYERFTPEGPLALLPVQGRYTLVWTAKPLVASALVQTADADFLAGLQEHFGDRAGRFTSVANRMSFPLKLRTVNASVALRTIIVGNAAQALHPVAGQGLNLGLRDAAALAGVLADGSAEDPGSREILERYRHARRRDAARGIAFTDFLVSTFADDRRLPTWGRGLGLALLDLLPPARRLLAERMIRGAPGP